MDYNNLANNRPYLIVVGFSAGKGKVSQRALPCTIKREACIADQEHALGRARIVHVHRIPSSSLRASGGAKSMSHRRRKFGPEDVPSPDIPVRI